MTIDWQSFTPLTALMGGGLIGLSTVLLLLTKGKVLGISGMIYTAVAEKKALSWRVGVVIGVIISSWVYALFGQPVGMVEMKPLGLVIIAGFLVGFGSRLGSGCTSGHGVCGLARLSLRSLVATISFMVFGFITVFVARHLLDII